MRASVPKVYVGTATLPWKRSSALRVRGSETRLKVSVANSARDRSNHQNQSLNNNTNHDIPHSGDSRSDKEEKKKQKKKENPVRVPLGSFNGK